MPQHREFFSHIMDCLLEFQELNQTARKVFY